MGTLSKRQTLAEVQRLIGATPDGVPGPQTERLFAQLEADAKIMAQTELRPLKWQVEIDGEDLLIRNAIVTAFGGTSDPQDDGNTASGVSTKPPETLGCALPMRRDSSKYLAGSPLPRIPWKTPITFSDGVTSITVPLIDEGPALYTGHAGDLTGAAARSFDQGLSVEECSRLFCKTLSIRITGGKQYLPPATA